MVVIVMGLPGSGKSYFAQRLATALHAEYISSDRVRKYMMAKSTYSEREKFIEAIQPAATIRFIGIRADEWLIKKRLQHTRVDSEADFEVYQIIKESWEPFPSGHLALHSTNDNIDDMLHKAMVYLHKKK